ncbi:MAG TPA: PEP-CTERM sorting domain-containing protein [Burkholderiales bacterium]|nr:PEP-CTERM sorting domain-containing protein [Burkholderiales bacterium]
MKWSAAAIHGAVVASFACAVASACMAAVAHASSAPGRETVIPRLEAALAVPEPTTLLLLAIALVALGYILRKRR